MEAGEDSKGPETLSLKQWIELYKMAPPIAKVALIISQVIVIGIVGYVILS